MKNSLFTFLLVPLFLSGVGPNEAQRLPNDMSYPQRNDSEINYDKIRYYEQAHLPFVGPTCGNNVEDCRPDCQGNF